MMKKAIIDQMMLGIFLFFVLIAIGATVSDNTEARDKYYKLKQITDNAVITVGKCYISISSDLEYCKDIYYDMLIKTDLGNEINSIEWTIDEELHNPLMGTIKSLTITATIPNYRQETFWYKFTGLGFFDLKISSTGIVNSKNDTDNPTSKLSYNIAPFAINCPNVDESNNCTGFTDEFSVSYNLLGNWFSGDTGSFYPVMPNSSITGGIDCNQFAMLGNNYNWSSVYSDGIIDGFNDLDENCTTDGNDEFASNYANYVVPSLYESSDYRIDFNNSTEINSQISLLGTYISKPASLNTQLIALKQPYSQSQNFNLPDPPYELDFITLGTDGKPNGVVRLKINSLNTSNMEFSVELAGSEYKTFKLIN